MKTPKQNESAKKRGKAAAKCERCRKSPGEPDHECPYASEINDDHQPCNCCSDCSYECAMDI